MRVRPTGRVAAVLAITAVLTLAMAGCGDGSDDGTTRPDGIKLVNAGQLTICTHLPYKPFQYKDGDQVVGFDVDLLRLLADDLGLTIGVVDVEWAKVTSGAVFAAGQCDIAMGAMTITEKRAKAIRISDPYMDATQVMLVRKDAAYQSLAELKGRKVGVQADTTGKDYAVEQAKTLGFEVVEFPDLALLTNNVKSGRVDAGINDNGVLYDFVKDNPDTTVTAEFDTGEQYGFAADRNSDSAAKLISRFNALLAAAKSDGTYAATYKKWFGVEPPK